MVKNNLNWRMA